MNYISADELKKHWGILDFELLKFLRDGLPAYDRIGRSTIAKSEVKYKKEETKKDLRKRLFLRESKHETERIEKNNSAEYGMNAHRLINAGLLSSELPPPEMYDDEQVRQRVETRIIEEYDQLPSFPVVPRDRRLIPDALNDSDLYTLLDEIKTFQFKIQEINQFAQLHELKLIIENDETASEPAPKLEQFTPETPDRPTPAPDHTDPEAFMRSMSVAYLSNTEVSIKVGNKAVEQCTRKDMGFDRKSTLWSLFIKVLKDREYHVGIYSKDKDPIKNKDYNKLVKQLSNVSKQVVSFLNVKYPASLPQGFNIFQNMKGHERAGTYKTKFHIVDSQDSVLSADIKGMSEKMILNKINTLSEQLRREKGGSKKDEKLKELGNYATHAVTMGWIKESQLRYLIRPTDEDVASEDAMSLVDPETDVNNI